MEHSSGNINSNPTTAVKQEEGGIIQIKKINTDIPKDASTKKGSKILLCSKWYESYCLICSICYFGCQIFMF